MSRTMGLGIRGIAGAAAAGLLAGLSVVAGPLATPAGAAAIDLDVYTADDFFDAVDYVNDYEDEDGQDDHFSIEIHAHLDFSDAVSVPAFSENLSDDAKHVHIMPGHEEGDPELVTISCDDAEGSCAGWFGSNLGANGSVSVDHVSVTGFRGNVIYTSNTDLTVEDSFFTSNGAEGAEDSWVTVTGSVIWDDSSDPEVTITIDNCDFVDNWTAANISYGGAVSTTSYTTIRDSLFEGNSANGVDQAAGGAIFADGATLEIFDTNFVENNATSSGAARGGAVWYSGGNLDVTGGSFHGNSTSGMGGAIYLDEESSLDTQDVYFASNEAGGDGGAIAANDDSGMYIDGGSFVDNIGYRGGAINLYGAYAEVQEVTFRGNSGNQAGGAIYAGGDEIQEDWSELYVDQSLFVDNDALSGGGALAVYHASEAYVDSTTFTENEAFDGAAISSTFSDVELEHVTIANNVSYNEIDEPNGGGQIWMQGIYLELVGTVIVDAGENRDNCVESIDSDIWVEGANAADDESCFEDAPGHLADIDFDPQLGPLRFNGGPTWTMLPSPDSLLVDAWETGQEGGCDAETSDQRGVLRPQGGACDIGAAETFPLLTREVSTQGGSVTVYVLNAMESNESEGLDVGAIATAELSPAPPAGVVLPYGALGLTIPVWDAWWPVDVYIESPAPTVTLWKLFDGEWIEYPGEQFASDTVWGFRLFDGADGDTDGQPDAVIHDPIGPGIVASFAG